MNLTLSIEDHVAQAARAIAQGRGTSLDRLINDYLEALTASARVERNLAELRQLSQPPQGDSQGWRFDRDEIYREMS